MAAVGCSGRCRGTGQGGGDAGAALGLYWCLGGAQPTPGCSLGCGSPEGAGLGDPQVPTVPPLSTRASGWVAATAHARCRIPGRGRREASVCRRDVWLLISFSLPPPSSTADARRGRQSRERHPPMRSPAPAPATWMPAPPEAQDAPSASVTAGTGDSSHPHPPCPDLPRHPAGESLGCIPCPSIKLLLVLMVRTGDKPVLAGQAEAPALFPAETRSQPANKALKKGVGRRLGGDGTQGGLFSPSPFPHRSLGMLGRAPGPVAIS